MFLSERTMQNMNVISDVVDMLIENMPTKFLPDQNDHSMVSYYRGISKLRDKYKDTIYDEAIQRLIYLEVIYANNNAQKTLKVMGAYFGAPQNRFWFNVGGFYHFSKSSPAEGYDFSQFQLKQDETITKKDLLSLRLDASIKTFKAVMVHEVRHYFQSFMYSKYYYSKERADDKDKRAVYGTSKVELDAAWYHNLEDFNPMDFKSVSAYTEAVMKSFSSYKILTKEEVEHYKRKTIRYYFEKTNPMKPDIMKVPYEERLKKQYEPTQQYFLSVLDGKEKNDWDLREIPGYSKDASRFYFPTRAIPSIRASIASSKPFKKETAPIVYFVAAMLADSPEKYKQIGALLRKVHKISINDAIDYADTYFQGGWDIRAMKNKITS